MTKIISITVMVFLLVFSQDVRASSALTDPERGVSFNPPSGKWKTETGFGNEMVKYENPGGSVISLQKKELLREDISEKKISEMILKKEANSRLVSVKRPILRQRDVWEVVYESAGQDDGIKNNISYLIFDDQKVFEVSCSFPGYGSVEQYFECKKFASSLDFGKETVKLPSAENIVLSEMPSPENLFSQNSKKDHVIRKNYFAYLDGMSGCSGVNVSKQDFERVAGRSGGSPADYLKAVEYIEMGRYESAKEILDKLSQRDDGFFARIKLADIMFDEGNMSKAEKLIGKLKWNSRLLSAVRMKQKRMGGDFQGAKNIALKHRGNICGISGARIFYELGLIQDDPQKAENYFLSAIESDPSFIPAYASLGKLYIKSGDGASLASAKIRTLLQKAPKTARVQNLSNSLIKW